MRLIFAANLISMVGSGMNSAGVTWFVLQKTHSEMALGTLLMLQTIPALMMLPFTGVVIDREDRRRLLMVLDAVRGLVILCVAIMAYRGVATLVGSLFDVSHCGGGLLDVLAHHHRADSGTHAGFALCAFQ